MNPKLAFQISFCLFLKRPTLNAWEEAELPAELDPLLLAAWPGPQGSLPLLTFLPWTLASTGHPPCSHWSGSANSNPSIFQASPAAWLGGLTNCAGSF